MEQTRAAFGPIAFPYPQFMAFAPLDVWFRLLFRPRVAIPPRYWLRLGVALVLSLFVTLLTLPERLLFAVWLRLRPRTTTLPGPVIILGYYRSGTTLLQYLLGCDANLYSPTWAQALAPQGGPVSWALLQWFILPFLPQTRPQDSVELGALVPAEDDFALNNGALASTLPGRVVVPQAHRFYDRFHDLKALTAPERTRWANYQRHFVEKLAVLAGTRPIVLKTPAHTARVEALLDLFKDTRGVKFVYIARHPHKVYRSNVAMLEQLVVLLALQPGLAPAELRDYLLAEYLATEEEYQRTRSLIPAGSLAEIRLQDLQADALGTMRRVYAQLGLPYTPALEMRMIAYLSANQGYRPNVHPPWTAEEEQRVVPALRPLVEQGRHDEPAPPRVALPPNPLVRPPLWRAWAAGAMAALFAGTAFAGLMVWLGHWSLWFAWPCGVMIGRAVLRGAAEQGSARLGAGAVVLTALVFLATIAAILDPLSDALPDKVDLLRAIPWWFLGLFSAYRIGVQRF